MSCRHLPLDRLEDSRWGTYTSERRCSPPPPHREGPCICMRSCPSPPKESPVPSRSPRTHPAPHSNSASEFPNFAVFIICLNMMKSGANSNRLWENQVTCAISPPVVSPPSPPPSQPPQPPQPTPPPPGTATAAALDIEAATVTATLCRTRTTGPLARTTTGLITTKRLVISLKLDFIRV